MHFVLRQHRPLREFVLAVLAVVLLVLAGWLLFDYGQWRHIYERMAANSEQRQLWELMRATENDNVRLRERAAILERSAQIDRQAYQELQKLVGAQQDDVLMLREELEFYRGVLADASEDQGLKVQGLTIKHTERAGEFRFKLVLMRVLKDDKVAKGTVAVSIEGSRGGHSVKLGLAAITPERTESVPFEFKHFRRIEGVLSLPTDFLPARVRIVLTETARGRPSAIKVFDWDDVVDREGDGRDVG